MATIKKCTITVRVQVEVDDNSDIDSRTSKLDKTYTFDWANGTGDNQINKAWNDKRTLASTSEDLDVDAQSLLGTSQVFTNMRGMLFFNRSTTAAANLQLGGHGSQALVNWVDDATDQINVGPGGLFLLLSPIDGYAVTAGTGDKVLIDSPSATVDYDVVLLGTG